MGLYSQIFSGDIEGYLSAIDRQIGYDLLASPRVTAINHHQAELLIGSKLGYRSTLTTETGTQELVEFLEVGVKLKFTPHISKNGYIRMSIAPSISEGSIIDGLPQENTTETINEILVKDGQTIVIGGLIKNTNEKIVTGIPILSWLPIIGFLFRKTELLTEKREIMVLVTPTIVTPEDLEEMASEADKLEKRYNKNQKKYTLF